VSRSLIDHQDTGWTVCVLDRLVGSVASAFSIGSAASFGSVLSAASRGSVLSHVAEGAVRELVRLAGELPCGRPGEGLTGKLDGEVGDAIAFLVAVRNMATHPMSGMRHELAPDFADTTHMRATYEVCEGIMGAVFERLNAAIRTMPVGCGGSVQAG
jgi:hypothetical protein